jgi:hypothetical protein
MIKFSHLPIIWSIWGFGFVFGTSKAKVEFWLTIYLGPFALSILKRENNLLIVC